MTLSDQTSRYIHECIRITHISLSSFLWDIGKQNSPRSNAAKRGVPSEAILFAYKSLFCKLHKAHFLHDRVRMVFFLVFGLTSDYSLAPRGRRFDSRFLSQSSVKIRVPPFSLFL